MKTAPDILADVSTFRLGGPCRRLISCGSPEQLIEAAASWRERDEPFVVIGGGSNLLFSDHGYDGIVLRFRSEALSIEARPDEWEVAGCALLDDLARVTAEEGMEGITCCHGIPGTVGGAIVGNAGAWGKQIGDAVASATVMNPNGSVEDLSADDLGFGYRHSVLKQTGQIVLRARLRLATGDSSRQLEERARILEQRTEKHPDLEKDPCIGSFFRNIQPSSDAGRRQAAGWFLEQAGAKAMTAGGARVYTQHANIIVKGPGCTAQDVRDLAARMQQAVQDRFDLALRREVRFLGRFRGEEGQPTDRFF